MLPNSEMLGGTAWRPSKGTRNCIGKRSAAAGASRAAAVVSEASRVAEGPQPKANGGSYARRCYSLSIELV